MMAGDLETLEHSAGKSERAVIFTTMVVTRVPGESPGHDEHDDTG